jgi:hypothetical protein
MKIQGKEWIQKLENRTNDFEGEIKWAFESRVPYLKDLCPEVSHIFGGLWRAYSQAIPYQKGHDQNLQKRTLFPIGYDFSGI